MPHQPTAVHRWTPMWVSLNVEHYCDTKLQKKYLIFTEFHNGSFESNKGIRVD